jgi:hypothetical protein
MAAATATAASEAGAVRLATHLFLTQRGVRFLVEQAFLSYEPPLRLRRPNATVTTTFTSIYTELLRQFVLGPQDLVLWGKGNMALTPTATQARWLHWFTFFVHEDRLDSTLSISIPQLVEANLSHALAAFYTLYCLPEATWLERRETSIYAEHHFAQCAHRNVLRDLYPTAYVAVEFFRHLVHALLLHVPRECHTTEAADLLREVAAVLAAVAGRSRFITQLLQLLESKSHGALETLEAQLDALADSAYTALVRPLFDALREAYEAHHHSGTWIGAPPPPPRMGGMGMDRPLAGLYKTVLRETEAGAMFQNVLLDA